VPFDGHERLVSGVHGGARYVRNVRKVAIIGEFNCMCDKLTSGETERRRELQVLG
jgi:hypothetical protein